jgi:LPXTG-motif cell wall-anchored protein
MNATVSASSTATPSSGPRWAFAVLIATGLLIVLLETTSLLVLLGAVLLGVGVYGILRRRGVPRSG